MVIRPFYPADETAVTTLLHLLYPGQKLPFDAGSTWVAEDGRLLGCLAVMPVPGLNGVFDLTGGVHPDVWRQGVGSELWTAVCPQLPGKGVKQVSHAVTNLETPAARFLRHHNFIIEHEEWLMHLAPLPPGFPTRPTGCTLAPLPRPQAVRKFQALYDRSFGGQPWYQPYSIGEVDEMLDNPADILFLFRNGRAIGFAWLQGEMIEPIGIMPEEQGKGYGRFLLQSALQELTIRGKNQAKIGVWRENETAVSLYQSLGFRSEKTITYLAYETAVLGQ